MSSWKTEIEEAQKDLSKEEVLELMKKQSEKAIDLDSLKPQEHRWVDRGLIIRAVS